MSQQIQVQEYKYTRTVLVNKAIILRVCFVWGSIPAMAEQNHHHFDCKRQCKVKLNWLGLPVPQVISDHSSLEQGAFSKNPVKSA